MSFSGSTIELSNPGTGTILGERASMEIGIRDNDE